LILDTNIIVWVLRGHPRAVALVDRMPLAERNLSSVSHLELLRGCRDKLDMQRTQKLLEDELGEIVPLDREMTGLAVGIMEMFALSRRPGIPDVLIAATAIARGEALATGNVRDFDYIPGLRLRPFVP
jgi:predicted nucleic acid-binding protein